MSDPITGLGVVASLSRVPGQYIPVKRTKDTNDDADLGKENLLRKSPRYLVLEKRTCNSTYPRDVIVDIRIVNSKESVPSDFILVEKTLDNKEKCFKGKYICLKFESWRPNMTAITDVAIFKSIEGLSGHTTVGEISDQRYLVYVQSTLGSSSSSKKKAPERPAETPRKPVVYSPMSGVPFKLTRDCRTGDSDDIMSRYSVHPKSREAIEDEYYFDFSLEKSLTAY
ncbi:unnamed protein product [Hymenolepis diminuta]|uniref:MABP domain-containing protein n=1 Tax=Hymenolepis diminuta TaxID=6216 RepID=A0A158QDB3_HYMDI|nr:unnamed protein product [Hymenolepis diminuta]VUZ49699.1 unnamed protein product [Hymenolepis diminuta]